MVNTPDPPTNVYVSTCRPSLCNHTGAVPAGNVTLDPRDPTRNATAEPCPLSNCVTSKLGSVDTPMKPNYERLYNSGATRIPFLPSRPR